MAEVSGDGKVQIGTVMFVAVLVSYITVIIVNNRIIVTYHIRRQTVLCQT